MNLKKALKPGNKSAALSTAIKNMTSSKSKENVEPNKITKKPNNLKGL